nr:uncharacterized protein LOC113812777 [Penaeus vannamei]
MDRSPASNSCLLTPKSNRPSRYAHELGEYDFALRYKQGSSNLDPDLLSRPAGEPIPHIEICPVEHPDPELEPEPPDQLEHHDPEPEPEPLDQLEHHDPEPEPEPPDQPEHHDPEPEPEPPDQPEDDPDLTTMDPRKMREQQLQDPTCNDLIRALRTYQNLCNSWYFPNMLRQSREYVARCPVCQHQKGSAVRVPMQGHPPPEAPLVMVSADLMDLRSSSRGYRYVLSIIDHHTRFLQLARLRDKTAERSNGVVERSNRAVKDALAALVQRAPSQWPIHLPAVCLALYMAIHRSVGDQPLYLLSGRMALFAKGLTNDQTPDEGLMVKRLSDACHLAVEVSLKTRETNKAYYDQRAKATPTFEQGSLVVRKV